MNKQQILIVEGLDMTGKTTLLNKLHEITGIPVYKEVRNERWYDHAIDLLYSEEARAQMLEQLGFSVLFDRAYPSEYVYSTVFGRRTIGDKIWELDRRYHKLGAKIIILDKDREAYQADDIGLIEIEKYDSIRETYLDFQKKTRCLTMYLNTTDMDTDRHITEILKFMRA